MNAEGLGWVMDEWLARTIRIKGRNRRRGLEVNGMPTRLRRAATGFARAISFEATLFDDDDDDDDVDRGGQSKAKEVGVEQAKRLKRWWDPLRV